MRAVVQRVSEAKVLVDDEVVGTIDSGLCVFLGVGKKDSREDADYLADKIVNLRIFADEEGKMNLSALDLDKELLIVSQFTLYGDCRQGRRPGYGKAASPQRAEELYEYFLDKLKEYNLPLASGEFKAMMDVDLINDGPVTLLLDSKKNF